MGFWANVDTEIKKRNIERKELASAVGFNVSLFTKGIQSNSSPSVDIAYKIAKELGVTVEYLMTADSASKSDSDDTNSQNLSLYNINHYKKHQKTIQFLESLPDDIQNSMEHLISAYSERYHQAKDE
ncbi:MAG: helix-turn-helix transcriptional regulator [Treponema sp.]|nr:helix-turn-helix transcriptional regulator [Treponema sp.]